MVEEHSDSEVRALTLRLTANRTTTFCKVVADRTPGTKTLTFANSDIHKLTVTVQKSMLDVNLEVTAPANSISLKQIKEVQELLQQELENPVSLKVRVIPANEFEASSELND